MSDLPPPLPGEIDREGEPPRDPIGDIQEWVRSYQEAPPHPPDEGAMDVVPETWYLAAVAERDAAFERVAEWKTEVKRLRRIVCTCTHGEEHWAFHASDCRYRLTTP